MRELVAPVGRPVLLVADLVRVAGTVCVVVTAVALGTVEAALFALVLLGLLVPRLLHAPPALDLANGIVLLAAAGSSVAGLYRSVGWLDWVMHLVATALLAAMAHLLLVRLEALPAVDRPSPPRYRFGVVLSTTGLGLTLAVLWEVGEWFGHTFLDRGIRVGYEDTLGDLVAGGVGALVAGAVLATRAGSGRRLRTARSR